MASPPNSSPMQSSPRPGNASRLGAVDADESFIASGYSLGQPSDLHDHVEVGRALARVDTFERGHVGVVAADAHTDVLLGDFGVTGGVVVPPTPGPGLNPGVGFALPRTPHKACALVGV